MKGIESVAERTSETGGQYYEVKSESGATYSVTHREPNAPDTAWPWKCDCVAGTYGRLCKHVTAVLEHLEAKGGEG